MTTTQGEHAQPEALRLADALASNYFDGKQGRDVWDAAAAELRRLHAQVAALTAAQGVPRVELELPMGDSRTARAVFSEMKGDTLHICITVDDATAQPAAPQGGAYAELPEPDSYLFQHEDTGLTDYIDQQQVEWGFEENNPRWKKCEGVFSDSQMRDFADRTHALRASHGQAPAGAAIARVVLGVDGKPASEVHLIADGDELDVEVFDAAYPQRAPHRIANLVEHPTPLADSQPAPVLTSSTGGDWTQPTTVALRLGDAMQLLCGGKRPPDDMVQQWLDNTSESLQEFAASHGPAWAQGIGLIDAAMMMVDQPTEITTIDHPDHDHEHRAARAPADSGAAPAQQVIVDFAQVGTAGPFPVVDGRVALPDATMQDLVHMLRPTFNAQAADSVLEDADLLDFIEQHPEMSLRHRKGNWAFAGFTNYEYEMLPSLRDAIRAARKQGANHD